jgi:nucleoside-diphosphate-sugar epimerase
MVYGPRDREVLRVFRLAAWGVAPLLGSGRQELSAVFGPDLAAALLAVALNPGTTGQVYVACHDERFTSAQFLHAVGEALTGTPGRTGRKRVRLIPIPEPLGRRLLRVTGSLASLTGRPTLLTADKANELFAAAWTGDPAPLTRDTGWRARHDLVSGLALTAEWYRAAGWL